MKNALIKIIKFYKNLSKVVSDYQIAPVFYSGCRHYPTCSEYAILAIDKYGTLKGSGKALARLIRCNPFSNKFYDPI